MRSQMIKSIIRFPHGVAHFFVKLWTNKIFSAAMLFLIVPIVISGFALKQFMAANSQTIRVPWTDLQSAIGADRRTTCVCANTNATFAPRSTSTGGLLHSVPALACATSSQGNLSVAFDIASNVECLDHEFCLASESAINVSLPLRAMTACAWPNETFPFARIEEFFLGSIPLEKIVFVGDLVSLFAIGWLM